MGKIKIFKEIKKIAFQLKRKGKRIVFTNGCFDILHYGHVKYLERCRRLGDVLIVGVNSDSSVRSIKGKSRPVTGEKERSALIAALSFVDYAVIFCEKTPERLIRKVSPNVLVKGGDWKTGDIVGGAYVKETGGRVITVPFVKGYSTSGILKKIKRLSV